MIQKAIQDGVSQYGMQTFDQALMKLYRDDMITYDDAIKNCTNPAEFDLRARGITSASDSSWETFEEKTG